MSIYSSMYVGMSGMRANEGAIGVIGDNIANVNTIGFKGSRAVFADVLSQTVLGSAGLTQAGQGVALAGIQRMVSQGALLGTGNSADMAVAGDGYFMVADPGSQQRFYTRNGQFSVDSQGYLQTVNGLRLLGYPADASGNIAARLGELQIDEVHSPPVPTTSVDLTMNLNANDDVIASGFDPTNLTGSSNFTTSVTVYDSLGNAHEVELYFTHTAPGEWSWNALVNDSELDGGDPAATTQTVMSSGTLSFNDDGVLDLESPSISPVTFDGAASQEVVFDFGNAISTDSGDGGGTTQFASQSAVSDIDSNGYAAGELSAFEVGDDGIITGRFTNGQLLSLGQLALANFSAPDKLEALGGNLFAESQLSGQPAVGAPGSGGRGTIYGGTLEQSTVDLTQEFTQLILAQRGFQASSRTVTTADEMLAEVVNLKR